MVCESSQNYPKIQPQAQLLSWAVCGANYDIFDLPGLRLPYSLLYSEPGDGPLPRESGLLARVAPEGLLPGASKITTPALLPRPEDAHLAMTATITTGRGLPLLLPWGGVLKKINWYLKHTEFQCISRFSEKPSSQNRRYLTTVNLKSVDRH